MKKLLFTFILSLSLSVVFGQGLETKYQKPVADFIDCIKNQKREKLADRVSYPLSREYPMPDVKNQQEFLKRFDEIFDAQLIKKIANSTPASNWSAVGWRGIMLDHGDVWLSYDGKLTGVTYHSKAEKTKRAQLIKQEKESLYPAIRDFVAPRQILETPTYRIRIDDLGDFNYRYAAWPLKSKMSDKPDLVIENGELVFEGSGGNHYYEFKKDGLIYNCAIMVLTERGGAPALLTITKGDKKVLFQKAKIIKPF
jgi:hypothetical protein